MVWVWGVWDVGFGIWWVRITSRSRCPPGKDTCPLCVPTFWDLVESGFALTIWSLRFGIWSLERNQRIFCWDLRVRRTLGSPSTTHSGSITAARFPVCWSDPTLGLGIENILRFGVWGLGLRKRRRRSRGRLIAGQEKLQREENGTCLQGGRGARRPGQTLGR